MQERVNTGASQQNGVAERKIGVIGERVRTLLSWAELPLPWWGEAVEYCHDIVLNYILITSVITIVT